MATKHKLKPAKKAANVHTKHAQPKAAPKPEHAAAEDATQKHLSEVSQKATTDFNKAQAEAKGEVYGEDADS